MANWTDGPEYAPTERPDAFAAPVVAALEDAEPLRDLSAGAPVEQPTTFEEPRDRVPALNALVTTAAPTRDPALPFVVESAVMTAGSAWGSAHSAAAVAAPTWQPPGGQGWVADQPYASSYAPPNPGQGAYPAPGTPQWFGPGAEWAPPAPPVPATLANAMRASTWGLLIVLVVGGFVAGLSPFLLLVGMALAARVHYRRRQVRLAFGIALGVAAAAAVLPLATGQDWTAAYDTAAMVSLLGCWVVLVTVLFLQYTALGAGEHPEGN